MDKKSLHELAIKFILTTGNDYYNIVFTPEWAAGMCEEVSEEYIKFLKEEHSFPESQLKTGDFRADSVSGIHKGVPHTVAIIDEKYTVDLTAKQFSIRAEVPTIKTLQEFQNDGWTRLR